MKKTPKAFDDYFIPISHSHATRSKTNGLYETYKPRTDKGKTLVKFAGVNFWNQLPSSLTNSILFQTLQQFKFKLREYLLSSQSA